MTVPLLLLVGGAGVGKDTVANILVKNHGAVALSLADPIKQFAHKFFLFTEDQLWGSSELRDLPDERFESEDFRQGILWNCSYTPAEDWTKEICELGDYNFPIIYDNLQKVCSNILNETYPLTPRHVLREIGTSWGRQLVDNDLWVKYAIHSAELLSTGLFSYDSKKGFDYNKEPKKPNLIVISDGRFLNEVKGIKAANGVVWKIQSPQVSDRTDHVSEAEVQSIPKELYTIILNNDKVHGLNSLENLVKYTYTWTIDGTIYKPQS